MYPRNDQKSDTGKHAHRELDSGAHHGFLPGAAPRESRADDFWKD
jgi:hypothetical protein